VQKKLVRGAEGERVATMCKKATLHESQTSPLKNHCSFFFRSSSSGAGGSAIGLNHDTDETSLEEENLPSVFRLDKFFTF
jgi:hypothetical protein